MRSGCRLCQTGMSSEDDTSAHRSVFLGRLRRWLRSVIGAALRAWRDDDDLSPGVAFSLELKSFGDLTQAVTLVDDWRDLPGFDELLQNSQVVSGVSHDEYAHPLRHEGDSASALN